MEKLQRALEHARKKRMSLGEPAAKAPPVAPAASAPEADALWAALREIRPERDKLVRKRIVSGTPDAKSRFFDIMRTKILLKMRQNDWTRLAITSPHAGCGKTTIASNLAVGLSRQKDIRAIVFDFDLRHPGIAENFDFIPRDGFTDFLAGRGDFADHAVRLSDNIALVSSLSPVKDPTRYLLDSRLGEVLDDIERRYRPNLMIFDLPPMLVIDDTRAFLKNVDCAAIIAEAGRTTANQIDLCEREVGEYTNVLGVILNSCKFADPNESADYGYHD